MNTAKNSQSIPIPVDVLAALLAGDRTEALRLLQIDATPNKHDSGFFIVPPPAPAAPEPPQALESIAPEISEADLEVEAAQGLLDEQLRTKSRILGQFSAKNGPGPYTFRGRTVVIVTRKGPKGVGETHFLRLVG